MYDHLHVSHIVAHFGWDEGHCPDYLVSLWWDIFWAPPSAA